MDTAVGYFAVPCPLCCGATHLSGGLAVPSIQVDRECLPTYCLSGLTTWLAFSKLKSYVIQAEGLFVFMSLGKSSLCSLGCPGTQCVAQAGLKLTQILVFHPSECWDYSYRLPCPAAEASALVIY